MVNTARKQGKAPRVRRRKAHTSPDMQTVRSPREQRVLKREWEHQGHEWEAEGHERVYPGPGGQEEGYGHEQQGYEWERPEKGRTRKPHKGQGSRRVRPTTPQ
jgi:hypothetical protein